MSYIRNTHAVVHIICYHGKTSGHGRTLGLPHNIATQTIQQTTVAT